MGIKVAIHQNNFCPWLPFFYKMAMADKFVLLDNVQFEKNGFQNRFCITDYQNQYEYKKKWVTKSVQSGMCTLREKKYASGRNLVELNNKWIEAIKDTLEIPTELVKPKWGSECDPTTRLIMEIKLNLGDTYITNPDAKNKYLDEEMMKSRGIEIEYCVVPKHLQIHTFEAFELWGIDGTIKQIESARKNAKHISTV